MIINFPRDTTADNFPNLMVFIDKLNQNLYDMVLIDIEDSINPVHPIPPVIDTLRHTGVKVYNCYYDDEDIITLFPALAGSIIFHAFERELDNLNNCYKGDFNQVYRKARRLSDKNPYASGSFPRLSLRQTRDLRKIQEKECELRRESEPLLFRTRLYWEIIR